MIGFDAIGTHAIGELTSTAQTVTYGPFSRPTGDFSGLWFKKRVDYP